MVPLWEPHRGLFSMTLCAVLRTHAVGSPLKFSWRGFRAIAETPRQGARGIDALFIFRALAHQMSP